MERSRRQGKLTADYIRQTFPGACTNDLRLPSSFGADLPRRRKFNVPRVVEWDYVGRRVRCERMMSAAASDGLMAAGAAPG